MHARVGTRVRLTTEVLRNSFTAPRAIGRLVQIAHHDPTWVSKLTGSVEWEGDDDHPQTGVYWLTDLEEVPFVIDEEPSLT